MFVLGAAVGFVAGTRAGRDVYDKMMSYGKQVAGHPKVQQATSTAQTKAQEWGKTVAANAPGYAKNAAKSASSQMSALPGYMSNAKQAASSKMPSFGKHGKSDETTTAVGAQSDDPAMRDDVAPDGSLLYPADDVGASNGVRYVPGQP
jgi:hypothetical protein